MVDSVKDLDDWRAKMLENWPAGAAVSREEVDALVWFHYHSYADFAKSQLRLDGWTFREKVGDWLLVLKVTEDGIPQVAFVGSSSTTRCVLKARKLLRGPGLTLVEDKFR